MSEKRRDSSAMDQRSGGTLKQPIYGILAQ